MGKVTAHVAGGDSEAEAPVADTPVVEGRQRDEGKRKSRRAAESGRNSDRPVVVRSPRARWLWVVTAVLAAGGLFAAGVFAAGLMGDDEPDLIDSATQSLALQQLVQLSEAADQVVADARAVEDLEQLQDAGVQLQGIAVAVDSLADQMQDADLRDAVQRLADGYLSISVGLVVNNGAWTIDGAEALNTAKDDLLALLEVEPQEPAEE